MEFSEEFFKGEEREGFYIRPMVKKAWAAQIEVLEDLKKVCKKHNIRFFADFGTLLGTVRHKGYIPWDDDMDIVMIRTDYEKLIKVGIHDMPSNYEIFNFRTDPEVDTLNSRIINGRTINFDKEHLEKYHGCPYALGIDIFILDYLPRDTEMVGLVREIYRIIMGPAKEIDGDEISPEDREYLVSEIERLCNVTIDRSRKLRPQLYDIGDRIGGLFREDESDEVTLMPNFADNTWYHFDKALYSDTIDMPFENTTIPVPIGYEEILRMKYGDDYMTPIRKDGGHNYPFFKRQEAAVFEKFGFIPE